MKTFKKTIALLLAISMVFSFAACTKKEPAPVDPTPVDPNPPVVDPTPTEPESVPAPDFEISSENFPIIDGATAMLPYYEEMAARLLDLPRDEARKHVLCNTTAQAYINLIEGKADMIFCAPPSEDQLKYAASNGVELESKGVLNSGFVFFVNKSNPVNNLTKKQLHDIYAGKITNWKEVGGNDEEIIAYQRSEGSGSQSGLYEHLIDKVDVAQPPMEQKIGEMAMIVDAVSSYDNAKGAIGYSYYYYVTNMHYQEEVKLLSIDNVYPTSETISSGMYPFISKTAVWFNKAQSEDSVVRKIADYCAGPGGYRLAEDLGYVPSKNSSYVIPAYKSVKETYKFVPSVTANNLDVYQENEEIEGGQYINYINYVQISGLKNQSVQDSINEAIKAEIEKFKNTEPEQNYLGAAVKKYKSSQLISISTYDSCNVNNILSLQIWATYQLQRNVDWEEYEYKSTVSTLNFDLNTGKQIGITDIFDSKSYGLDYINSSIWDAINKNGDVEHIYNEFEGELMMAAPFTGIKENQKFVFDEASASLILIFDEDTPEFYVPSNLAQTITLPLQGYANIGKYLANDSLYENSAVRKELLRRNEDSSNTYTQHDYSNLIGDRNIFYWENFCDSENLGPNALAYARGDEEKSKALIEKAIAYYDENKDLPGDISVETVATTEIVPVGNYTSVAESYNFFCYHNNGDDFETKDSLNLRYHCFKAGSDEELLFVEIFKDGVDFREALKKALLRCFEKNIIDGEKFGSDQPSLEAFVEAAVHDINGFALYRNYMLLSYTKLSDIILRFLEVPEKDFDEYESMMRLVHYDFFDEGVLDIFE